MRCEKVVFRLGSSDETPHEVRRRCGGGVVEEVRQKGRISFRSHMYAWIRGRRPLINLRRIPPLPPRRWSHGLVCHTPRVATKLRGIIPLLLPLPSGNNGTYPSRQLETTCTGLQSDPSAPALRRAPRDKPNPQRLIREGRLLLTVLHGLRKVPRSVAVDFRCPYGNPLA